MKMKKNFFGKFARKIAATFLVLTMLFATGLSSAFAAESPSYQDTNNHWADAAIGRWTNFGVMQGDGKKFNPNATITRAEMATTVSNFLGLKATSASSFSDVDANAWYADAMSKCVAAGIFKGDNGNVRPNDQITKEEATVVFGRTLHLPETPGEITGFKDGKKIAPWAAGMINTMANRNLLNGDGSGNFQPDGYMTRAESVTVLDNAVKEYINKPGTYSGAMQGIVLVVADGVVFDNAKLSQDLLIAPGVGKGAFEIKNSSIKGAVTVEALGCQFSMTNTQASSLNLATSGKLLFNSGSVVDSLLIQENAKGSSLNLAKGASLNSLVSNAAEVNVEGSGTLKKATINGSNTAINTVGTVVSLGDKVTNVTANGKPIASGVTPENKPSGGGGSSSGDSSDSNAVQNAKALLSSKIAEAELLQKGSGLLHDWQVLSQSITKATAAKNSTSLADINNAIGDLNLAIRLINSVQTDTALMASLKEADFTNTADYEAAVVAADIVNKLTKDAKFAEVETAYNGLKSAMSKRFAWGNFVGTTFMNNWEVNQNGIKMVIAAPTGYHFAQDISNYKDQIIDGITFNHLQFNKKNQTFDELSYADFSKDVLSKLSKPAMLDEYVTDIQKYTGVVLDANTNKVIDPLTNKEVATLMENGVPKLGASGQPIYLNYIGVQQEVQNALKAEGTVSLDASGNLVIACDNNGYFKNFTNQIRVTNGGVPISLCDLLMYVSVPAEAVQEKITIKTQNYFNIKEMKFHMEVWEYVATADALDSDGNLKQGIEKFSGKETNGGDATKPTYYMQRVAGDTLTEADIRTVGTGGPNGRSTKLLKVCCDVRVGPTKWAADKKATTFIGNFFRTAIDASSYGGNNDIIYTPADDAEWLKVEDVLLNDPTYVANPMIAKNTYYVNYSGDKRGDTVNPAKMWLFIEVPTVADFNISQDMLIYCNLIGGMIGGSGQSVSKNGEPATGHDGRYFFTIQATDDGDLKD